MTAILGDEEQAKGSQACFGLEKEDGQKILWKEGWLGPLDDNQIKENCGSTPPIVEKLAKMTPCELHGKILGMTSRNCSKTIGAVIDSQTKLPKYPKGQRREAFIACMKTSFGKTQETKEVR